MNDDVLLYLIEQGVDWNASVESSLNSGLWGGPWTAEGLHPNATGAANMAASFPTGLLV